MLTNSEIVEFKKHIIKGTMRSIKESLLSNSSDVLYVLD